MKKYHVYGIGNALVDMEYEVDEDFFQQMKIEKGVMTLVDESRQQEILNQLAGMRPKRACGGSAANTLIAAAQMGGNCFYSCKVGDDELGHFYRENLWENGVDGLNGASHGDGTTGKCLVMITPDADRTMNTFLGITQTFGVAQLSEEDIKNSEYLYIEGYLVTSPNGREAMMKARDMAKNHGVKVALSLSDPFIVRTFRKELRELIGTGIDFIFCNESEALLFTEETDILAAHQNLKKWTRGYAITKGASGAQLFDGKDIHQVSPYQVKAIDTNGAGDMFAGAFLYGITHGMSYPQAGDLASLASSRLVTQFGPRLSKESTQSILSEIVNKHKRSLKCSMEA